MACFKTEEYHYDKQTLLSEHESLLARTQNNSVDSSIQTIELQTSKLSELNNLQAIQISDLTPGVRFENKLIYSTQITPLAVAEVICFIIEDEYDNVCRVSVPGNVDTAQLVRGVKLAFSNPIYKMAFDGRYSLIVHNISNTSLLQFGSPLKPIASKQISNSPTKESLFPLGNPIQFTPNAFNTNLNQCLRESSQIATSLTATNPGGKSAAVTQFKFGELNTSRFSFTFDKEFLVNPIRPLKKIERQRQPIPHTKTKEEQLKQMPQNPFQISAIEFPELSNSDVTPTDGYDLIQEGNALFREGRFLQAIVQYTCAINANNKDAAYYQNRAFCYLKLNEIESALLGFLKANLLDPANVKIQYLIALTWSKLGNYKLCLDLLNKIKPKDNVDSQSIENLMKEAKSFIENINGKFDFGMMRINYSKDLPIIISDYIGSITILHNLRGRGVFTTREVKKGDNLCVVKAVEFNGPEIVLCCCDSCSLKRMQFSSRDKSIHAMLIEKARKSKLTTVRLASLCDKSIKNVNIELYSGCGFEFAKNFDTSRYPLDVLQSMIEQNICLDFDNLNLSYLHGVPAFVYGIWLLPSFMNHSCIPNAVKIYIGDICIVRAITDIPDGEEVFISYLPLKLYPNPLGRNKVIGYKCVCKLCKFEINLFSTEFYSELVSTYNYLYFSVKPNECKLEQVQSQIMQISSQEEKEKLSRKKWLEIKNKLINIDTKLLFDNKYEYLPICFKSTIIILLSISQTASDALDLLLEVQSFFSILEPHGYVLFWNTFHDILVENNSLKDPRFKHVEKKRFEAKKLFI